MPVVSCGENKGDKVNVSLKTQGEGKIVKNLIEVEKGTHLSEIEFQIAPDAADGWQFDGYYVNGDKIKDTKKYVINDNIEILVVFVKEEPGKDITFDEFKTEWNNLLSDKVSKYDSHFDKIKETAQVEVNSRSYVAHDKWSTDKYSIVNWKIMPVLPGPTQLCISLTTSYVGEDDNYKEASSTMFINNDWILDTQKGIDDGTITKIGRINQKCGIN